MDFEPQKFFTGMMDFFSIFLPGALLTFVLKQQGPTLVGLKQYPEGVQGWVVFLLSATYSAISCS